MYENIIVPFDGSLTGRAALAPATDLAWRLGARVVIINNSEVSDEESKQVLKSRAMARSGADVDFWVDDNPNLGKAVVEALRFRANPIVCISGREKAGGLFRGRGGLGPVADEILLGADCPVLVVGPETDTSQGLSLTEVIVALDGSTEAEQVLPVATAWARRMKLRIILAGVVSSKRSGEHQEEREYLQRQLAVVRPRVPASTSELIEASDPVAGLIRFAGEHPDSVLVMSTHGRGGSRRAPLGPVAAKVVARCPRAVLLQRPTDHAG